MDETAIAEHFKRHIQKWSSDSNCSNIEVQLEVQLVGQSYSVDYKHCNIRITTPLSKREIWFYLNGTILKTIIYDDDTTNYYGTEKQTVVHKSYYQQWLKENSRTLRRIENYSQFLRISGGVATKFATSGTPLSDDIKTIISSQTMVDLQNPNSISEAEQQLTTALNDITGLEVMDIKGELEVIVRWGVIPVESFVVSSRFIREVAVDTQG